MVRAAARAHLDLRISPAAHLLDYIDAELTGHQVIYSTHSSFMVDVRHFDRMFKALNALL